MLRDRLAVAAGASDALDVVREQLARPEPPRPLEELQAELDALVGLETVKEQVRALVAFLQVQARRLEHGLPEVATSQHLVFLGNPGTGKTTIARLLAQMYRSMGLLEKGHLVEVDRAELVGEYVGTTAIKTDRGDPARARRRALRRRGVRARAARARGVDFGPEAIETLLKRMEDYRHRLVVIVAGYPRLMHQLPRLESRPALAVRARDRLPRLLDGGAARDHARHSRARTSTRSATTREAELRRHPRRRRARRGLRQRALRAHALRAGAERAGAAARRRGGDARARSRERAHGARGRRLRRGGPRARRGRLGAPAPLGPALRRFYDALARRCQRSDQLSRVSPEMTARRTRRPFAARPSRCTRSGSSSSGSSRCVSAPRSVRVSCTA